MSLRFRSILVALIAALVAIAPSCKGPKTLMHEYAYVSAPQVNVRDRLAAVYNKVATLKNGDRVEVVEKQKRFVKVRVNGQEGWVEQRYLVDQDVYDGFAKLAKDNANTPAQGKGITRAELNIHLDPARDSEHLFQLKDGEKVDVLKRGLGEKKPTGTTVKPVAKPAPKPVAATTPATKPTKGANTTTPVKAGDSKTQPAATATPPAPQPAPAEPEQPKVYEDWWLVRNSEGRTGWVLARMIDLDVPLDIAQYAEGQRIQGVYILNKVQDGDKQVPQYLVVTSDNKDGQPWDFSQIRIFTWNLKRHRYETAYRDRNLFGVFPVSTGTAEFDKEGVLPYFVIREKQDNGQIIEKKYRLNGPIVRRVATPAEQAADDAKRVQQRAARAEARKQARAAAGRKPAARKTRHHR